MIVPLLILLEQKHTVEGLVLGLDLTIIHPSILGVWQFGATAEKR